MKSLSIKNRCLLNSKIEIRNPKQIRMSNDQNFQRFKHLNFEFRNTCFEITLPNFEIGDKVWS